jgi:hypothetical protein
MPTMVFRRDNHADVGCLEYSWVPEGVRQLLLLKEGEQDGSQNTAGADEVSHVQVYRLVNDGVGIGNASTWQFPPGPPYAFPVVGAVVQVLQDAMRVIGTVEYEDGTTAHASYSLQIHPLACPEPPPESGKNS